LRRQIRDCIRRVLKNHAAGYDLVFVARHELSTLDYEQILRTVETALWRSVLRSLQSEGTSL
jgi:ribonuclease P protein component